MSLTDDLKKYKVFFGGCARNIGHHLDHSFALLEEIRQLFSPESVVCIIENDSSDNTISKLQEYEKQHTNVKIYQFTGLEHKMPKRTVRLAFCRNFLINLLHTNYGGFDYFINVDLDNILRHDTIDGLKKCFQLERPWDALFANASPVYYDIWALRSEEIGLTYDCWDKIHHEYQKGVPYYISKIPHVKAFQTHINPGQDLIEVQSAFGGFGIYKVAATKDCRYVGEIEKCEFDEPTGCNAECCEHVHFHKDMISKNGAKLYIAPFLLVTAAAEHI
jgi:hypothetical protein